MIVISSTSIREEPGTERMPIAVVGVGQETDAAVGGDDVVVRGVVEEVLQVNGELRGVAMHVVGTEGEVLKSSLLVYFAVSVDAVPATEDFHFDSGMRKAAWRT